jgi:protein-disulfide isomerase
MTVSRRSLVVLIACLLPLAASAQTASSEKAAEVNGRPILATDLDAKIGPSLSKLQEQMYTLRQKQLDAMIDERLLEDEAARRKVTIAALVEAEITSKITPATSEDATKFFEENKEKLKGDLKTLEEQIKKFLTAQRGQTIHQEFIRTLRQSANIQVLLTAPPVVRSEVATAGAPSRGAADAPVTIVEFSDFQCPFCRRVQPTLDQLRKKYGDKIRIVYRDLPLENLHPQAKTVAEAARCAHDQGKFWEYHDKVFGANPDGASATLSRYGKEIGLDMTAFEECRVAGKH